MGRRNKDGIDENFYLVLSFELCMSHTQRINQTKKRAEKMNLKIENKLLNTTSYLSLVGYSLRTTTRTQEFCKEVTDFTQ